MTKPRPLIIALAALSLTALAAPRSALSATLTWNGDFAQWQAPGGWDGGILPFTVPGSADTARFYGASSGNTTVYLQDARSVNGLFFENTVDYGLFVGNGASTNAGLTIGSGGITHTSGAQSRQTIGIPIRFGASATINTATQSGGLTRFTGAVELGNQQLSVVGAGLTEFRGAAASDGALIVGTSGTGRLSVFSTLATADATIGQQAGASGVMTVDGGTWNAFGNVLVGGEGTGSLTVTGGGRVDAKSVSVADKTGVIGTLTVSGASTLDVSTLYLGQGGGAATLNLQAGSLLNVSDNTYIGTNTLLASTGGTLRTRQLLGDGRITATSSGGVPLTIDQSGNSTFGGSIRNQSANLSTDFTKAGAGELALTGRFDINGVIRVNRGTLRLNNDGQLGSTNNFWNTGAVVVDGRLVMQNMGLVNYANGISGNGTLELRDNTDLTLINANSFSGTTFIGAGASLSLGNGAENGGIGGNIVNNGSLVIISSAISNRVSNSIIGTGSLSIDVYGAGSTTLTNDVSAGSLSVGRGKLTIDTGRTLTTGGISNIGLGDDAQIVVGGAGTIWNAAQISVGSASANGRITISDGGKVTATDTVYIRPGSVLELASGAMLTTGDLDVLGRITLDNGAVGNAATITVTDPNVFSVISGTIENAPDRVGGFIKQGAGYMLLSGNNTYTGVTDIREGNLGITGTSASSAFLVSPGATLQMDGTTLTLANRQTLGGGGTVIGNLHNAGGIVAPGMSPGTLTLLGNYVQGGGGILNVEIASQSSFDRLLVSGNATLGGTLNISFLPGFVLPAVGPISFDFMTVGGTLNGFFDQVNVSGFPAQTPYRVTSAPTGTGSTGYRISLIVIPETSTGLLALLAAPLGLLLLRRNRIEPQRAQRFSASFVSQKASQARGTLP